MSLNVIDWLSASAKYMAQQRPDIYTFYTALDELSDNMEYLRSAHENDKLSAVMCGGFVLIRTVEDEGMEEFILSRIATSVVTFQPEGDCLVLSYVPEVSLPKIDDPDDV